MTFQTTAESTGGAFAAPVPGLHTESLLRFDSDDPIRLDQQLRHVPAGSRSTTRYHGVSGERRVECHPSRR
jgi:hypothetical protein